MKFRIFLERVDISTIIYFDKKSVLEEKRTGQPDLDWRGENGFFSLGPKEVERGHWLIPCRNRGGLSHCGIQADLRTRQQEGDL